MGASRVDQIHFAGNILQVTKFIVQVDCYWQKKRLKSEDALTRILLVHVKLGVGSEGVVPFQLSLVALLVFK